jgi:hypothetical protein
MPGRLLSVTARFAGSAAAAFGCLVVCCVVLSSCARRQPVLAVPTRVTPAATAAPVSPRPAATTSSSARPVPAAAVANRARTIRETQRLVGLAKLPPSAAALPGAPTYLDFPAGGLPESDSTIDTVQGWRTPMSLPQAMAWIRAHAPAGLKQDGGLAYGRVRSVFVYRGYTFAEPDSDAWTDASLQISVGGPPNGTSTVWRIDGLALWLDPVPVSDQTNAPRLRVTIAGGCPRRDTGAYGVRNIGRDLTQSLLPAGQPTAVLVCDYSGRQDGAGTPAATLQAHGLRRAADAAQLAGIIRQVRLAHIDGGTSSSPPGLGTMTIFVFAFPGRADVDLAWLNSGWQELSNGFIMAHDFLWQSGVLLQQEVRRLTR